jgi:hypothetical protein
MTKPVLLFMACLLALLLASLALATETENQGLRVVPAPGKVVIDGNLGDWDLSAGIFACGDVEHLRDQFALWMHAMADADNLYLVARWKDPTPLNNPETAGGHGFNGDCLQVRFILFPDTPDATTTWWDFWRDARGVFVVERGWPGPRNGVPINPLERLTLEEEKSVTQACKVDADGAGYAQEIAIPWKLLSVAGRAPKVGEAFRMTVEPNFTAGSFGRITIKDLFDPQVKSPDRIFTFRAYKHWGFATRFAEGKVAPQPVRLADNRTFPVTLRNGQPSVDWTGVVRKFEWPGFKPVTFTTPADGAVSLNILDANGRVVRHLLNADTRKAGTYTVQWDGLTDATYRTPGMPVPAGAYTWKAITHPGAKMTFRGAAVVGGRMPWQASPKDYWLGDHGVPSAVVTDGERMYLACNGAEGGRHLLAADFQGNLLWGLQNTTGAADPEFIAVADGVVYVLHPKARWANGPGTITRADAKTGAYVPWPGTRSHILSLGTIWPEGQTGANHFTGIAVRDGKVFLTASDPAFFPEDIVDWKAFIALLKGGTPLARRVFEQIRPETITRLDQFLAGRVTQEQAFATWNGGPRFDNEAVIAMTNLLSAADVAPDTAKLSPAARALANRRYLEAAFAPAIRPLPADAFVVLDVATGKVVNTWPLPLGGALAVETNNRVYALAGGTSVVAIDPATGKTSTVVNGLQNASSLAVDAGKLYVSVGAPDMQVQIFTTRGKKAGAIGRKGGRISVGPWQADGMYAPAGVAVDREGKLWVMEHDRHPKRVSLWNLKDGTLVKDFFGPTHYGASGGAINPRDPNLMVGVGCEWRIDPTTGKAVCVGTFDRNYHEFATFREGTNGHLYLYTNTADHLVGGLQVWERLGDANYIKRAELRVGGNFRTAAGHSELWVDVNGDGQEQPAEVQGQDSALFYSGSNGWSVNLGPDLTVYVFDMIDKKLKALPAAGFTACGAPKYDLAALRPMPDAMSAGYELNSGCALPSADNKSILLNLRDKNHPAGWLWECFDLASGALKWTYPNPYFQVHGSHNAPPPDQGLFRGAFGPVGAVTVPGAGDAWIINGNVGEWNVLTAEGYYLSRLFNGNIFEQQWPEAAIPGSDMTNVPPGCGGEDFGGSVTQATDGKIYIQSGKMALWNLALTGLESTAIPGGAVTMTEADVKQAQAFREAALQAASAGSKVVIKRTTATLTGNLNADFKTCPVLEYQKVDDARVRTALAHDDTRLYIGWEVRDSTPWINGATDIAQMYACGDTVDLQLGADPAANPRRADAKKGDLRLSIGNYKGKPTAVLYKFVSDDKRPRTFTSGVIQGYQVDWVDVLAEADVKVKVEKDRYTVEAAIPLASLGLTAAPGTILRGDVGVTHGEPSGTRTKLRTYWSNQQTGLVDDVVFELKLTPANWGEMTLE